MNPLDYTIEELEELVATKEAAFQKAARENSEANNLWNERMRLEKLKASLGSISNEDIKAIQTLLGPAAISTQEEVNNP